MEMASRCANAFKKIGPAFNLFKRAGDSLLEPRKNLFYPNARPDFDKFGDFIMRPFNTKVFMLVAILPACTASVSHAGQNKRNININGERMNTRQMALVDQWNCGERVPNGSYWLKNNGAWGVAMCALPSSPTTFGLSLLADIRRRR